MTIVCFCHSLLESGLQKHITLIFAFSNHSCKYSIFLIYFFLAKYSRQKCIKCLVLLLWESYPEMSRINQVWHNAAYLIKNVSDMDITTLRIIWGFSTGTFGFTRSTVLRWFAFPFPVLPRCVKQSCVWDGPSPDYHQSMPGYPSFPLKHVCCDTELMSVQHTREKVIFQKSLRVRLFYTFQSNWISFISPFETSN